MNVTGRHHPLSSTQRFPLPSRMGSASAGQRIRLTVSALGIMLIALGMQSEARAASISYPLSAFTLLNSNSDGTALSPDGGISVILTGGNNGSGLTGTTDLLASATRAGTIAFTYTYSSLDEPRFDWAGYLVGDLFTRLADTNGQSGTAAFTVASGDTFGFRTATFDNTQEPGVFTISNFVAGASSVPEPATLGLGSVLALFILRAIERRRSISAVPEKMR
jgi:hypothetical protein